MFVCMFYAPMPMSMPSHACMLGFTFSHAFMFISTCLDVYPHAFMLVCVDRCVYMLWIDVLYMLYAIFRVLVRFMPCLCA